MDRVVGEKIEKFFGQYTLRTYPKGQILILNGNPTNYVFHLKSGIVKQYDISYRGEEIILNLFKPPAFFPMSLAINGGDSLYTYEAQTSLEVQEVPIDEAVTFLKQNPDVLFDLLSRVYNGVDGLLTRVTHLMSSSARDRLLFELLIESRRFGKKLGKSGYVLEISEKELGARAGLSRETISREISKLSKNGIVKTNKQSITVPDIQAIIETLG
jgi:CRP-like cAMP-binding protein